MPVRPPLSGRGVLLIIVALFLVTRLGMLNSFPIFNDEAIYVQYAQFIHGNWHGNRFISMNYTYGDWKPPLQYWLGAPFVGLGNDPLIAARLVAVVVSFVGLAGFYLFTRQLFGEAEAVISALLYVLCPTVLFHNDQFIAETFLFSTAPVFYWATLKALTFGRAWWAWAVGAALLGAALLLFKQSGALLLAGTVVLSIPGRSNWRSLTLRLLLVVALIVAAKLIAAACMPVAFDATKVRFNSNWVMSARELLQFPYAAWRTNVRLVSDYIGAYYSWLAPMFVAAFFWVAARRRDAQELALGFLCVFSGAAVCLLLRGFNEYIFNTAIIVSLLPIIARTIVLLSNSNTGGAGLALRRISLTLAAGMLLFWVYQDALMTISPARWIERSTPWAVANYLRGRPTGFGIRQIVAMLEKEKRPGVIFADAQWGNPRTALEIYNRQRFPNLKILPALREFREPGDLAKFVQMARDQYPVRFAIYSADPSSARNVWQRRLAQICADRREIREAASQVPIVVCEF